MYQIIMLVFFLYSTLSKLVSVVCVCIYGLHHEEQLDVLDVKSPPLRCGDAATELLARKTENKESEAVSDILAVNSDAFQARESV